MHLLAYYQTNEQVELFKIFCGVQIVVTQKNVEVAPQKRLHRICLLQYTNEQGEKHSQKTETLHI